MSTKTLRKRISLVAVTALTAGVLSVVAVPSANASNTSAANGQVNGSLMVATDASTQPTAALATAADGSTATSKGLLYKDTSSGLAQSAVVLTGGTLSLYAEVSTAAALSATGGTFSGSVTISDAVVETYNTANTTTVFPLLGGAATYIASLWTAPVTAGTYTVSLLTGFQTNSAGVTAVPSTSALPPTLSAFITVSVVAASAGGSYSASTSICQVSTAGAVVTYAGAAVVDNTAIFKNGDAAYINFDLNDAYGSDLDAGNITVTSTGGALVNLVNGATSILAGTGTTDLLGSDGTGDSVRIDQGTAGAPVTTTITISYNATVVCTKTISIRGAVAKLTVENIGTQNLGAASTANGLQWMYQKTALAGAAGQFTVVATDSAGNVVSTDAAIGSYAAATGSTSTQIPAITVNTLSTTSTASSASRYNFGGFSCGATAGEASVKITFTDSATAKVTTSDAFTARCAGSASTYTVSLDKAAYGQGEIAKATVKFIDSKGFKANNMTAVGANSWTLPYMTAIDSTIAAGVGASATAVADTNGEIVYMFAVGTATAAVAGTYTGLVTYSAPALGVSSTPTYKLSTGGDTTTNADVLKSIVALIASINKQIQALQKLILQRR